MDFRLTEQFTNLSYLAVIVIGLLTLLVRTLSPNMWPLIWLSMKYRHIGSLRSRVDRIVPMWAFRTLLYLLEGLGYGFVFYRIFTLMGLIPTSGYNTLLYALGGASLTIFILALLHAKVFNLWRYIFFTGDSGELLDQDYLFQDWIRASMALPLALIALLPIPTQYVLYSVLAIIFTTELVTLWNVMRRLRQVAGGYLLLFLYLCAYEIIPFLYIIGAGIYLTRSDLLPNLFQ